MRKSSKRRASSPGIGLVQRAVMGNRPATGAELRDVRLAELVCIDALAAGTAAHDCARHIKLMALTARHLAGAGIGPEVLPLVSLVLGFGLVQQAGALSATPAQVETLRELFDLHDQQRELCGRVDYLEARARAFRG